MFELNTKAAAKYSFAQWWKKNSAIYEAAGISKSMAHSIWNDSLEAFKSAMKAAVIYKE